MQALDTMAEIQERHEAVKDLETSLLDLHQIFLDMSVLVEAQGEMLDNIEKQVSPHCFTVMTSGLMLNFDIAKHQQADCDSGRRHNCEKSNCCVLHILILVCKQCTLLDLSRKRDHMLAQHQSPSSD